MAAKDEKKVEEMITAVYRMNLHCQQCALDIKKPLMRTEGVHSVEVDTEKAEIKVKGVIDVIKIQKQIEKLSKKKVELISPQIKIKETAASEKKVVIKETKEPIFHTTSVKVHMHCDKCENDLRKKLLKHKGIHSVKTDMKAQTLTVQGTIEPDKLLVYLQKKVHKNAVILSSKSEKKEAKKEEKKVEQKIEKLKVEKKVEQKIEKLKEEKKVEQKIEKQKEEKKVEQKIEKQKAETKSVELTEITEFKAEKKVEAKTKEGNIPYFVHYVYAPQLFSDENPNACFIM